MNRNVRFTTIQACEQITSESAEGDDEDLSSEDEDYGGVERVDDDNDGLPSEQSVVDSDENENSEVNDNNSSDDEPEQLVGTNDDLEEFFYSSKNGTDMWLKEPVSVTGRHSQQNVLKQAPGPTAYASRRANSPQESLELFITTGISTLVVEMSNKEGVRVFGEDWKPINMNEFNAYLGLLYLAGVFRSAGEATEELWDPTDGRKIFRAVMSLKRFQQISRIIRFDNKDTRTARRARDRLAPIRDVFDAWVKTLPRSFIPYENVTIDEQLVAFRGRCSFRMFMKSKPAKYGLKLWALCDSTSSYALKLQVEMSLYYCLLYKKQIIIKNV
jgi:hypothetical protein